jgi:hypothetical protein
MFAVFNKLASRTHRHIPWALREIVSGAVTAEQSKTTELRLPHNSTQAGLYFFVTGPY